MSLRVPSCKRSPVLKALKYIEIKKPFNPQRLEQVTGKSVRVIMFQLRLCGFIFDRYFDGHKVDEYVLMKEPKNGYVYRILGEMMHREMIDGAFEKRGKRQYIRKSVLRDDKGRQAIIEALKAYR